METAYETTYRGWLEDPEGFWARAAESVHWYKKWDQVLDTSHAPFNKWFAGGLVNTCYNALDVHVENGRAEQLALIYDSPVTGVIKSYTYRNLLHEVALFAGALQRQGVRRELGAHLLRTIRPAVPTQEICPRYQAKA